MKTEIRQLLRERLQKREATPQKYRQKIHLMADTGWISDPNGLCQLNGENHIFHQYTPDEKSRLWKSWGHWTTPDWIHYTDQGTLMTPEAPFDKDGCYSGSGYVRNGKMHLFYTGNILEDGDYDYINEGRGHYTNHLSSEDGIHFSGKEILLKNEDYPDNMSCHVRDPKVSDIGSRTFLTLGARTRDSQGCALLYEADPADPTKLKYIQTIYSRTPAGYMWECPDLFDLDGRLLLLTCPQGMEEQHHRYENIYQNGWFTLGKNPQGQLEACSFHELDNGFDFYAPQTMTDDRGRRILLGWMGMPDADYTYPEIEEDWIHCLTLPRQLQYKNGRIWQYPLPELEALRLEEQPLLLKPEQPVKLESPVFELHLQTGPAPFELQIRKDVRLTWNGEVLVLTLGSSGKGRRKRHIFTPHMESLEIFSDVSSLEIFVNHGEYAFTTRVYDAGEPLTLSSDRSMQGTLWYLSELSYAYGPALAEENENRPVEACADCAG